MVIFDHVAVSILLPGLMESFHNVPAVMVSVISSILPDLTPACGWRGKMSYIAHRKSHTFLSALFLSVIPVALVYLVMRSQIKNTIPELYVLAFFSYSMHIIMDTTTPFGTQFFYPFSEKVLSLDLLASLEPVTNSLSVMLIIFSWRSFGAPVTLNFIIFISLYLVYLSIIIYIKYKKTQKFRRYLKNRFPDAQYIATVPRLFWKWKGIAKYASTYIVMSDVKGEDECKLYPADIGLPDVIKESKYYKAFMAYARIPVTLDESKIFSLINLIYTPHTLRLNFIMAEDGSILRHEITGVKWPDTGI